MKHKFTHKGLTYYLKYDKVGPVTQAKLFVKGAPLPIAESYTICSLKDYFSPLKGRKIATARILQEWLDSKNEREVVWQQLLSK